MQMAAYLNVNMGTDEFAWMYAHVSKWQYATTEKTEPYSVEARCLLKVTNDFSFMDVTLRGETIRTITLDQKSLIIERLGMIGKYGKKEIYILYFISS